MVMWFSHRDYDGLSDQGELSYVVEDAPFIIEHGHRRRVMGTIRGTVLRKVSI
jgi:hypothetical protein